MSQAILTFTSDWAAAAACRLITVTAKIYAASVTRECAASPSMRAVSDGVRALLTRREAGDRAQPAAPVRWPRAGDRAHPRCQTV